MKLAHLNSLNLRELLGRVTTKVLPVGAQSLQAAGEGRGLLWLQIAVSPYMPRAQISEEQLLQARHVPLFDGKD